MRSCQSFCFCLVLLIPSLVLGQNNQTQQYQRQLENTARTASPQEPVTARQQQQATPEQMRAMQDAITQQQRERNNPLTAVPNSDNFQPQLPEGFPLSDAEAKHVNDVLVYWQHSSEQVKRSSCEFTRRTYNPEDCNVRDPRNNHLFPSNISLGKLYFATPDQGRFETDECWNFEAPPIQAGEEPKYTQLDIEKHREKWICDGRAIYQYDYANKRLNEVKIPLEHQGNGLINSPLPFFLFGADTKLILERYWIRPVTPAGVDNAYWLEAYPKRIEDARIYKKLEIILARDDCLPNSLVMYAPNYQATNNPTKQSFEFANRKVNSHLDALKDFFTLFRRPPTQIGWKRVDLSSNALLEQPRATGENSLRR